MNQKVDDDTAETIMARAARDVMAERHRQVDEEGFDPAHDDAHRHGQLTRAAIAYATHAVTALMIGAVNIEHYVAHKPPQLFPWDRRWWKPKNPRYDLIRAAALLMAEIERIDRSEAAARSNAQTGVQP